MDAEQIRAFEQLQITYAEQAFDRGEISESEYYSRVEQHQQHIDDTFED